MQKNDGPAPKYDGACPRKYYGFSVVAGGWLACLRRSATSRARSYKTQGRVTVSAATEKGASATLVKKSANWKGRGAGVLGAAVMVSAGLAPAGSVSGFLAAGGPATHSTAVSASYRTPPNTRGPSLPGNRTFRDVPQPVRKMASAARDTATAGSRDKTSRFDISRPIAHAVFEVKSLWLLSDSTEYTSFR